MDRKESAHSGERRNTPLKMLIYVSVFPLILVLTGGCVLAVGWYRQAEMVQTIGAVIAGVGCVALFSRFLRGRRL